MLATLIRWMGYRCCQPTVARLVARGSCPCPLFSQADVREGIRALATLCQHLSANVFAEGNEEGDRIVQAGVGACCTATDRPRNADAHSSRLYYHLAHRTRRPAGSVAGDALHLRLYVVLSRAVLVPPAMRMTAAGMPARIAAGGSTT